MHLMMSSKSPASSSASPPLLDARHVKKEAPDDEIKDFAETAMNELLGWYGYDSRGGRALLGKRGPSPAAPPTDHTKSPKSPDENDDCAWCNNPITPDSNPLNQSIGDKFCSELCFSQSRRATFKRAKTCDWCRHIRHTVSYVDFQDGATQLQFCSDKCLNQYKMHIFCRETQAHLDLNPHLINATTSNTNLITPDLWLKNCRSRSVSPTSDHSTPPNVDKDLLDNVSPPSKINLNISPEVTITNTTQTKQTSSHPMITVAPPSKLMRPKPTNLDDRMKVQTTPEMRREHRILKTNSKRRRNSRCSSTVTSLNVQKHNTPPAMVKPQDLTIRSPSLSQESSPNSSSLLNAPHNIVPSPPIVMNPRIPNIHPGNFPNPLLNFQQPSVSEAGPHSFHSPRMIRPPFFPQQNFFPRPYYQNENLRPPIPPSLQQMGLGAPPPLTVLVPYPIIIPIPLPIPIPIPIMNFLKAYESKKWPNETQTHPKADLEQSTSDEPLDFTMNGPRKNMNNINNNIIPLAPPPPPQVVEAQLSIVEKTQPEESNSAIQNINIEFPGHLESADSSNPEQTLPRFKITRLGAKMAKIVIPKTKELSESTRPLRKRRRLVEPTEDECAPVVSKTRKQVHA